MHQDCSYPLEAVRVDNVITKKSLDGRETLLFATHALLGHPLDLRLFFMTRITTSMRRSTIVFHKRASPIQQLWSRYRCLAADIAGIGRSPIMQTHFRRM